MSNRIKPWKGRIPTKLKKQHSRGKAKLIPHSRQERKSTKNLLRELDMAL